MKSVTIILLMIATLNGQAQNVNQFENWQIDDEGALIWQRVIDDSTATPEVIITFLKSLSYCYDIEQKEQSIYAKVKDHVLAVKGYKGQGSLPYIYKASQWKWAVVIDTKPGKYRVTLSGFYYDAGNVNAGYVDVPIVGSYDEVVVKKDKSGFKNGQLNFMSTFSKYLADTFTVKKKNTSDW